MALKCRMRLQTLLDDLKLGHGGIKHPLLPDDVIHHPQKLLIIDFEGASTAAETEIDPVTNKDQVTTAVAIEWLSSNNEDKNAAAGAVRKFNVIGVDGNNEPVDRQESMHAATGTTVVASTNLYKDVWHPYASLWGTADLDATGQIDVRKLDDTIFASILAAANEGNGSGFKLPTGWAAFLLKGKLMAVGAQAADEGKILKILHVDSVDVLNDVRSINYTKHVIYGTERYREFCGDKIYLPGTEITFFIQRVDDGDENFEAHLEFLLWKL